MAKNQPVGTNKWLWSLYYQPKPCIITWGNLSKLPCIHPEIWPFLRPPPSYTEKSRLGGSPSLDSPSSNPSSPSALGDLQGFQGRPRWSQGRCGPRKKKRSSHLLDTHKLAGWLKIFRNLGEQSGLKENISENQCW